MISATNFRYAFPSCVVADSIRQSVYLLVAYLVVIANLAGCSSAIEPTTETQLMHSQHNVSSWQTLEESRAKTQYVVMVNPTILADVFKYVEAENRAIWNPLLMKFHVDVIEALQTRGSSATPLVILSKSTINTLNRQTMQNEQTTKAKQYEQLIAERGLDLGSVQFIETDKPIASYWTRDITPLTQTNQDGSRRLLQSNKTDREDATSMSELLSAHTELDIYDITNGLSFEGGNIAIVPVEQSDQCFFTSFVKQSNGYLSQTNTAFETNFASQGRQHLGCDINVVESSLLSATPHIDMYMRSLEATMLVGQYEEPDLFGNQAKLEHVADQLISQGITVERMLMPPVLFQENLNKTTFPIYTNATIINSVILVPQYASTIAPIYAHYDQRALNRYRQLLPGFSIVPIDMPKHFIKAGGSIHCLTSTILKGP